MTPLQFTIIAALAMTGPGPEPSPLTISGPAAVIDGDSLSVAGVRIRLYGIDAPEMDQRCFDERNQPYNCGALAADALDEEIAGAVVVCHPHDTDQYGRTVAICTARGNDLGELMVRRGHAVDVAYFSGGFYGAVEKEAQAARRGMWAGKFTRPAIWRWEHKR